MKWISILLATALLWAAGERPAHAYLDPGSVTMVLGYILAGLAGLVVMARAYWRRLLTFLGIRKAEEESGEERNPSPPGEEPK